MVRATRGCMLTLDETTVQFVLALNEEYEAQGRPFLIMRVDLTHIFVKEFVLDFLQVRLDALLDENTYRPEIEHAE